MMSKKRRVKGMGAALNIDKTKLTGLTTEKKEILKKFVGKSSSRIDWNQIRDEYKNESNRF